MEIVKFNRRLIWVLFVTSLLTCVCYLSYYHWSRRKLYAAAQKIRSQQLVTTLPIIGDAHLFLGKVEDIFLKVDSIFEKVEDEPFKFWLGHILIIGLKNPLHLENPIRDGTSVLGFQGAKIMSSSRFAYKHELYTFLGVFLGDGLVSASGLKPKYKLHRRIIQPLLDLKFVRNSLNILEYHTNKCMDKLEHFVDKETFDIHNVSVKCFMDIISEIILGRTINSQDNGLTEFCKASINMYNIGFKRLVKPWLHPNVVYNLLPDKAITEEIIRNLNKFIQENILESAKRIKSLQEEDGEKFIPIIDKMSKYLEEHPNDVNSEDFMNHLMTLFTAAFDTLTIVSSFAILCFGMYPEYQQTAAEEIRSVIGEIPRHVTLDELHKLTYLDMCLKDVMRLFPIAPFIVRRSLVDFSLDKWTIPKEAAIFISIYHVHRDKNYWKCPNHFYPNHFLPDEVRNRHIFSYLPFSAGPRGCIGKTLANVELKLFLCKILQRYEIEADGKVPDLKLRSDISLRPKHGYNCRIRRRIWK